MSAFTWAWVAWGAAFCVIEGVALVNSSAGDTLSEHVWAWLGVRTAKTASTATPKWTLRVARTVAMSFLLWLGLHLTTGGWV